MSTECSGLFLNGVVEKSMVLQALPTDGTQPELLYWVDPAAPTRWQDVIRNRIMPTLAEWTHSVLREYTGIPVPVLATNALHWFSSPDQSGAPDCSPYTLLSWIGCAERGSRANAVTLRTSIDGIPYPSAILNDAGLHEALHVLFDADHSVAGLMCIAPNCYRSLRSGGYDWANATRLRPLDREVYKLYGNPLIQDGMTLEEVARLVRAR